MSEKKGFRIKADLSDIYDDHRNNSFVMVKCSFLNINDLLEHVQEVFQLEHIYLAICDVYIPPGEDIGILNKDDILQVKQIERKQKNARKSRREIKQESSIVCDNETEQIENKSEDYVLKNDDDNIRTKGKKRKKNHEVELIEASDIKENETIETDLLLENTGLEFNKKNKRVRKRYRKKNNNLVDNDVSNVTIDLEKSTFEPVKNTVYKGVHIRFSDESQIVGTPKNITFRNSELINSTPAKIVQPIVNIIENRSVQNGITEIAEENNETDKLENTINNRDDEDLLRTQLAELKYKTYSECVKNGCDIKGDTNEENSNENIINFVKRKFEFKEGESEETVIKGNDEEPKAVNTNTNKSVNNEQHNNEVNGNERKYTDELINQGMLMKSLRPMECDIIAFKLLKLSPDYTPEISKYIVAKVTGVCNRLVDLNILEGVDEFVEPAGKFSIDKTEDDRFNSKEKQTVDYIDMLELRLIFP